MKKGIFVLLACGGMAGLTGCASLPALPSLMGGQAAPAQGILTATAVQQSEKNFHVVKADAVGTAKGFKLLGLISLKSANYTKAMTKLYADAAMEEGRSQTLANVIHEKSSTYFILFSIPKVSIRADLIEFVEPGAPFDPGETPMEEPAAEGLQPTTVRWRH